MHFIIRNGWRYLSDSKGPYTLSCKRRGLPYGVRLKANPLWRGAGSIRSGLSQGLPQSGIQPVVNRLLEYQQTRNNYYLMLCKRNIFCYFQLSKTSEDWRNITRAFKGKYEVSFDGKHISIYFPPVAVSYLLKRPLEAAVTDLPWDKSR